MYVICNAVHTAPSANRVRTKLKTEERQSVKRHIFFMQFGFHLALRFVLTAIDIQFSSWLFGNLTMNFEPAFSSLSFSGRKRHTTRILSSAAISRSADIFNYFCFVFRCFFCVTKPKPTSTATTTNASKLLLFCFGIRVDVRRRLRTTVRFFELAKMNSPNICLFYLS